MNLYAASAFLDEERIARELPPLSETSCPPADHAGIWRCATCRRFGRLVEEHAGRPCGGDHAGELAGADGAVPVVAGALVFVSMRSSSIIFCQSLVNFLTPGSPVRFTVTVLPSLDVE